jgi:hypothetical protein
MVGIGGNKPTKASDKRTKVLCISSISQDFMNIFNGVEIRVTSITRQLTYDIEGSRRPIFRAAGFDLLPVSS